MVTKTDRLDHSDGAHDLRSGHASFTPRLGLLSLLGDDRDPGGADAVHEMAHAQTFAGSDFYAAFAARTLRGEDIPMSQYARFLEIVPEVFSGVGSRSSPGTMPDVRTARQLHGLIRRYHEIFDGFWRAAGLDPDQATSPAAEFAGVSGRQHFDRHCVLMVVQTALELALVRVGSGSPEEHVGALHDRLDRATDIPIPVPGMNLRSHLELLMRKPQRRLVGAMDDELLLSQVLVDGSRERLFALRPLLSAVVRLEYLIQSWPPAFQTLFFAHPTLDHPLRLMSYVEKRDRSDDARLRLTHRLLDLRKAVIEPSHEGKPVRLAPELRDDVEAQSAFEVLSLRSYIAALPAFLEQLLTDVRFMDGHCGAVLEDLKRSGRDACTAFLWHIAQKAGRRDFATLEDRIHLVAARDERGEEVVDLSVL